MSRRVLVFGNSGPGKSTLAARLCEEKARGPRRMRPARAYQ